MANYTIAKGNYDEVGTSLFGDRHYYKIEMEMQPSGYNYEGYELNDVNNYLGETYLRFNPLPDRDDRYSGTFLIVDSSDDLLAVRELWFQHESGSPSYGLSTTVKKIDEGASYPGALLQTLYATFYTDNLNWIDKIVIIATEESGMENITFPINPSITEYNKPIVATFDLSTLNLSAGSAVAVVGKAEGYKDSVASAEVIYSGVSSPMTIEAGTYVGHTNINISDLPVRLYPLTFICNEVSYVSMNREGMYGKPALYYIASDGTSTYAYDDYYVEWWGEEYQTITLETDQEVDEAFGTWFNANFEKQPDTVTLEAGTYVANNTLTLPNTTLNSNIEFTSNDYFYNKITVGASEREGVKYIKTPTDDSTTSKTDMVVVNGGWVSANYQTIKLDTAQEVSEEFATWFNANFEKQPDTVTIEVGAYVCDKPSDFGNGIAASQALTFTSNSENFTAINFSYPYFGYGGKTAYDFLDEYWTNDNYKTITLSTDQEVSPEFGEWFNSNFVKQVYTTLTVSNTGDTPQDFYAYKEGETTYYDNATVNNNETYTFTGVTGYVETFFGFGDPSDSTLTNCRQEYTGAYSEGFDVKIYITGENATYTGYEDD